MVFFNFYKDIFFQGFKIYFVIPFGLKRADVHCNTFFSCIKMINDENQGWKYNTCFHEINFTAENKVGKNAVPLFLQNKVCTRTQ